MKNPFSTQTLRIHNLDDNNVKVRKFFYFLNFKYWETEKMEYHEAIQQPEPHFPILMEHYLDELLNPTQYANDQSRAV